jgi:DNA-binding transcriptional MerR regulator
MPFMPAEIETLDLSQLSAAAGVTPRTIRYYVQQGLLPSPGTRGPGTRYERAHLDRLQLIRRLQRLHLPLAEIRKRLEALDDDGVRSALAAPPDPEAGSAALDYVRDVLARQSARMAAAPDVMTAMRFGAAPRPSARGELEAPAAAEDMISRVMPGGRAELPGPSPRSRSTRSTWERISLAPDVELHVRRPLSRDQNRQVERLLEAARDLFAEEF